MDFRSHIRATVSKMQRGIEIGASYAPILPKAEGYGVYVVDHASHDELRSKYGAMGVDTSRIEPVDAIDDGGEFTQLLEDGQHFDYIVASHVFEHLPDPIHFLQRCDRALGEHGRLILLIPDRRFTFDYLRPVSTTGQLLRAYLAEQRRHDPARSTTTPPATPRATASRYGGTPAAGTSLSPASPPRAIRLPWPATRRTSIAMRGCSPLRACG
jgi:SAM-dependent methyltransferase